MMILGIVLLPCLTGKANADPLDPAEIKAILRTATPQEDCFVDRTVAMVAEGTLPRDLFDSCFIWARKKPKYKFQYFKRALIVRATDAGIQL